MRALVADSRAPRGIALREVPEPALDPRLVGGLRWQGMPNALQRLQDLDVTGQLVLTLGP